MPDRQIITDLLQHYAKLCVIHLIATLQGIPQASITKISVKITHIKYHWNLPGANELIYHHSSVTHICFPEFNAFSSKGRFSLWYQHYQHSWHPQLSKISWILYDSLWQCVLSWLNGVHGKPGLGCIDPCIHMAMISLSGILILEGWCSYGKSKSQHVMVSSLIGMFTLCQYIIDIRAEIMNTISIYRYMCRNHWYYLYI